MTNFTRRKDFGSSTEGKATFAQALDLALLKSNLIEAFKEISKLHTELGAAGQANSAVNRFGEQALILDVRAEEILINRSKTLGVPFRVVSEEHGDYFEGEGPPVFTLTIDGLDGSLVYLEQDFSKPVLVSDPGSLEPAVRYSKMYGSMAAIHLGGDHKVGEYLVAGQIIHSPHIQIFISVKDEGCKLLCGEKETPIKTLLTRNSNSWRIARCLLPEMAARGLKASLLQTLEGAVLRSMAAGYADILEGRIDFFVDWTRKRCLEQTIGYAMLREMGGTIVTSDGADLGHISYDELKEMKDVALITVRDVNLVPAVLELLGA